MFKLYLNNYRWFKKSTIEIKDVNFLVWENSTWKSSFINALNFISSEAFWFEWKILKALNISSYSDVSNEEYFDIWLCKNHINFKTNDNNDDGHIFVRVRIKKVKWKAELDNLIICTREYSLCIQKKLKNYYYKRDIFNYDEINSDNSKFYNYVPWKLQKFKNYYPKNWIIILLQFLPETKNKNNSKSKIDTSYINSIYSNILNYSTVSIAPIRAKPQSIYQWADSEFSSDWTYTPYIIQHINSDNKNTKIIKAINTFWKKSWLFDKIITKNYDDNNISWAFSLMIQRNWEKHIINNVWYWVSQILPLITENLVNNSRMFLIQQPEVHLHPKAQAAYWEFIFDLSTSNHKIYIIETHSDFIIDRFRLNLNTKKQKVNARVLFFESKNNLNHVHPIDIEDDWNYSKSQPINFRKFFLKEWCDMLWIN